MMDENSKLKMMLFFDSLRTSMNDIDDPKLPRLIIPEERGYFIAVGKMNFLIQEFIDNEIRNDDSLRKR